MRAESKNKTVRSIFYIVDIPTFPKGGLQVTLIELNKMLRRAHRVTSITRVERTDKITDMTNKYL